MPIVNYVREHMRFIEYASDEHLTASERLVWYALMHIMNQRAQGNIWPDEFIRVSNDRLLSYCPMKFDTMAAARNSLKQRGLIEIIPGDKNKKSPAYRMMYFYPQYAPPETEKDGERQSYPKNSDYMGDNIGGNTGDNIGGNTGDCMGDIYINYTKRETCNSNKPVEIHTQRNNGEYTRAREGSYVGPDGKEYPCRFDNAWAFSERARGAVAQRILDQYRGDECTYSFLHGQVSEYMGLGMPPELIEDIVRTAKRPAQLMAKLNYFAMQRGYMKNERTMEA